MNELYKQQVVTDLQKSCCAKYGHPHTNKDESLSPMVTSLFSIDTLRSVTTALCVLRPFLLALILSGRPMTGGYHFYDKSQAFACSTSCTMPSGLMRYRVVITFSEFIINHSPLDFSLRFLL